MTQWLISTQFSEHYNDGNNYICVKIGWASSQDSEFSIADSVQVEVITSRDVVEEDCAGVERGTVDFEDLPSSETVPFRISLCQSNYC